MQREYRGKRVDTKEWVYGYLIECGITGKSFIFPAGSDANESDKIGEEGCLRLITYEVIPETVGQYTGLKDKNGKEIYEGDIIRFKHEKLVEKEHEDWDLPYDFETNKYYRNYVVEFTNTNTHYGLRLRNKNIWFVIHKMTLLTHDSIVIGNIHDNPELLQEVESGTNR